MTNQLQQLRQAAIQQTQKQINVIEKRAQKQIERLMSASIPNAGVFGKTVSVKTTSSMFEAQITTIINSCDVTV